MVRSKHNLWDLVASIEEEALDETGCVDGSCDETESSVEVTDAIESESNAMELAEDVADAEEGAEVIEETISVAEDIEEQVEANETIIEENPAAVTDEVVAASQEMFFVSLARINFTPKKLKSLRVGLEDNAPPLTKLRVSTEGVKDILKALWEKVKAMFQHAWVMLKNLFVKALFWFQNLEKKVDKLIAEVKTFKDEYILNSYLSESLDCEGYVVKFYRMFVHNQYTCLVFELVAQNILTFINYFDAALVGIPIPLIKKIVKKKKNL